MLKILLKGIDNLERTPYSIHTFEGVNSSGVIFQCARQNIRHLIGRTCFLMAVSDPALTILTLLLPLVNVIGQLQKLVVAQAVFMQLRKSQHLSTLLIFVPSSRRKFIANSVTAHNW